MSDILIINEDTLDNVVIHKDWFEIDNQHITISLPKYCTNNCICGDIKKDFDYNKEQKTTNENKWIVKIKDDFYHIQNDSSHVSLEKNGKDIITTGYTNSDHLNEISYRQRLVKACSRVSEKMLSEVRDSKICKIENKSNEKV